MRKLSNRYGLGHRVPCLPASGDYWIAPDARVIGAVTLGEGASIWWGAVLRGDNEPITVGGGTNVQEQCIGHVDPGYPLVIGDHCTIGHRVTLHGCTIGDGSLIGMGAIVLNGARIGANCLIGAGALVPEGMTIPNGNLVLGVPARIKRKLSSEEVEGLTQSAARYRQNKERFKAKLKPFE